jgi:hypothetical protein
VLVLFNLICSYEMIWSPTKAKEKGIVLQHEKDGVSNLASNIREAAFLQLARLDYNVEALHSLTDSPLKPSDGTDWSQEQKDKFHADIFRFRRNIRSVAKSMDIPLKTCHAYYLGTYKCTPEYLLLKTICIDERNGNADDSQQSFDVCVNCGDGGNLIICDGCEGEYHMSCLHPQLRSVPAGYWLCDECVDQKALEVRDLLIQKSKFFDKVSVDEMHSKKRLFSDLHTAEKVETPAALSTTLETSTKFVHRPSEQFVDAISKCSLKINNILRS